MFEWITRLLSGKQTQHTDFNELVERNRATMRNTVKAGKMSVSEVFIDTNADVYYSYNGIDNFPLQRFIMAESLRLQIAYGVSPQYLEQAANEMEQGLKQLENGEVEPLAKAAFDHVQRLRNNGALDGTLFCKLAALYIIRHDETPERFDEAIYKQKVERAKESYSLQSFFLQVSYESILHTQNYYLADKLNKLGIKSIADLKNYLND